MFFCSPFTFTVGHQAATCPKAGTPTWYLTDVLCYRININEHCHADFTVTTVSGNVILPSSIQTKFFFVIVGGLEGHVSRDCTMEAKPKTCYKCGLEGHIVRFSCRFPSSYPSLNLYPYLPSPGTAPMQELLAVAVVTPEEEEDPRGPSAIAVAK